jgi:hypothetical protein
MDKGTFDKELNRIFCIKEDAQLGLDKPNDVDSVDMFRQRIKGRLTNFNKDEKKAGQIDPKPAVEMEASVNDPVDFNTQYPQLKDITAKVGTQPSVEAILSKLSQLMNVPVEKFSTTPNPYPTGEIGVFVKDEKRHPDPLHVSNGPGYNMPKVSNQNIGDIWKTKEGFIFKNHQNHFLGSKIGSDTGVVNERENPIGVSTIKNNVMNYGPEALGQIISKLSAEMNKTGTDGQPTSEFNQFVDAIKQDGLELILKQGADAGGVKVAPNGEAPVKATPNVAKKEPGQELASL